MIKEFIRCKAIKCCMYRFKKCLHKHDINGAIKCFEIAMILSTEEERNEVTIYLYKERDKLNKEVRG